MKDLLKKVTNEIEYIQNTSGFGEVSILVKDGEVQYVNTSKQDKIKKTVK